MKRKNSKYYLGVLVLLWLAIEMSLAQNQQYIIQTAYIEKFANYIEWPPGDLQPKSVFKIVIVGNTELCNIIQDAFASRRIKGMQVEVECTRDLNQISDVDLLFLVSSRAKDLETAISLCRKQPFLLVTDSDGFAERGAHVNFYVTKEQTIHFEMNKTSLDKDKFKVDFLLLDFAKVIQE